jgi:hypothetical protein
VSSWHRCLLREVPLYLYSRCIQGVPEGMKGVSSPIDFLFFKSVENHLILFTVKSPLRQQTCGVDELHWLRISERIEYKVLLLAYKCLHNSAPEYLKTLYTVYKPNRRLRSTLDGTLLVRPRSRLLTFGDRAFSSAAPRLWNQLPSRVKEIASISAFKVSLKSHLFGR